MTRGWRWPTRVGSQRGAAAAWGAPVLLGVLATGLTALRLLFPSAVGLADNGDGPRLMCHLGVWPGPRGTAAPFDHATLAYVTVPDGGAAGDCPAYPSSTRLFMEVAKALSPVLPGGADLDLRVLVLCYAVAVGVATTAVCRLVGRSWMAQAAAAGGWLLIAGDSAFALYAGSPFTETAAVLGLVLMVPSAVVAARPAAGWWQRVLGTAALVASGLLTVTAKVPMVTVAAPLVAFLCWLAVRREREGGRRGRRRWGADVGVRLTALLGAVLVTAGAVGIAQANPESFRLVNATDTLFAGVLPWSEHPEEDLRDMGLPPELARYAGASWWDDDPPQDDPAFLRARDRVTYRTIAAFLVTHPDRVVQMADVGSKQLLASRPPYLGNYQVGEAAPRAQECRVCLVSSTAQRFQGMGLVAVGFLAMVLTTGSWHLARRGSGPTQQAFGAVAALLTGISAAQFLTAAYGEGIETTKHMVIALMAGAFAVYTLVIALVAEEPPSAGRTPDETRGSTVDRHAAHGRP